MKATESVSHLYEKRAFTYESLYVKRLGWARALYDFFRGAAVFQPGMRILDAGCGTGIITRTLIKIADERGHEGMAFYAFDLTPAMLEVFRTMLANEKGSRRVEMAQANVLQLDLLPPDWNQFDVIISSALLEYLPEDRLVEAVRGLKQRLSESGRLLVFATRRNWLTNLTGKLWWKTRLFQRGEIQRILQEAGFERIRQKELPSKWSRFIEVFEAGNEG